MTLPRPQTSTAPSHVFIVRHGSRMDQADNNWSISSPTPYDTPLSYGGWTQTRSIGVRIADILQQLPPSEKKKRRLIIHSSPFLRCVQTSVSIASGIALHHHHKVTETHWLDDETGQLLANEEVDPESAHYEKPLLRLDSWLGEWLAQEYYTEITPPPPAAVMAGTAKSEYLTQLPTNLSKAAFEMAALQSAIPPVKTGGYLPPSPNYAISTNGMIPHGFVEHAKDYVELDLGWDSTKLGSGAEFHEEWSAMHTRFRNGWKRLLWYYASEEQRVATNPIQWKKPLTPIRTPSLNPMDEIPNTAGNPTPPLSDAGDDDEEEEVETVLILVTHGAGSNALIGAITHEPVLIDIGVASLTMAVRRESDPHPPQYPNRHWSQHTLHRLMTNEKPADPPVYYDLKLTADRTHLRPAELRSPLLAPITRMRTETGPSTFQLHLPGAAGMMVPDNKLHRSNSHNGLAPKKTGLWGGGSGGSLWGSSESRPSTSSSLSSESSNPAKPFIESSTEIKPFIDPGVEERLREKEREKERENLLEEQRVLECELELETPQTPLPIDRIPRVINEPGKEERRGLWTATWAPPPACPKRRWTVGREGLV